MTRDFSVALVSQRASLGPPLAGKRVAPTLTSAKSLCAPAKLELAFAFSSPLSAGKEDDSGEELLVAGELAAELVAIEAPAAEPLPPPPAPPLLLMPTVDKASEAAAELPQPESESWVLAPGDESCA